MKQIKQRLKSVKLQVNYITLNLNKEKKDTWKMALFFNQSHQFKCYFCDYNIDMSEKKLHSDQIDP